MTETMPKYRVKYEKSPYNPNFFRIRITFDVADGVKLRWAFEALDKIKPEKREKAWEAQGIEICVRGGFPLGDISKAGFEAYNAFKEMEGN
jgi:hypothetical protein